MVKSSSLELSWPFSTRQMKAPFFFTFSSKRRLEVNCLSFQKFPPQGLATLPGVLKAFLHPWKPISASCAHGLSPSKLFSFQRIETKFPSFLSDLALSSKTLVGLRSVLHRFYPRWKAVLFVRPEGLDQGGGIALLGLTDLSGFPFRLDQPLAYDSQLFPFSLLDRQLLAKLVFVRLKGLSQTKHSIFRLLGR